MSNITSMSTLDSIVTSSALKACFNKTLPGLEFNKENLDYMLSFMTPQEVLFAIADYLDDLSGGTKVINIKGKDIPIQAFVRQAWLKMCGYEFPDDEAITYSTAYLCSKFEDLNIDEEAIGNAVSEGYIMERKDMYG